VTLPPSLRALRRLMYCGEWIESHALHIYLLQGPDFGGMESAWTDRKYRETLKQGLKFKRLGNEILTVLGGRPVHPVSVRIGGFHKVPDKKRLSELLPGLESAWKASLEAVQWTASLPFRKEDREPELVALSHEKEYPMNEGKIISNKGLDLPAEGFIDVIKEYQVEYSTALHSGIRRDGAVLPYNVGPVARLGLNREKLPDEIKDVLEKTNIPALPKTSMGIAARAVEVSYAFFESIRIIGEYEDIEEPFVPHEPRAGMAVWATEAPRGTLIHRYDLDENGCVLSCNIIPPTSQNLAAIEDHLLEFVRANVERPSDFLRKEAEKIIRGYDPCISCATHLTEVKIERRRV
jgi:sulfhydrogenase subunit alpha